MSETTADPAPPPADASGEVMIEVDRLTRVYRATPGARPAVDGISFQVSRGEVLGFLGPNGAGKSTTMKMLTCYLPPTSGTARVAGHDIYGDALAVRRNIGYLPEDTPLYRDMTVLDYLLFTAEVRGVPAADRRSRIRQVGDTTGILRVLGKYVSELSRGYRQRVGLTQALLHDPPVVILDEPTSGLDPNQIVEIRELIREIGTKKTVILSTHILPEVQATCSRVIIINDGKLVADGRPDELVSRERSDRYRLLLADRDGDRAAPPASEVEKRLRALPGVRDVAPHMPDSGATLFAIEGESGTDLRLPLFRLAADAGWPLLELDRREASLEEVFARLTRTDSANAQAA
jgi:ABC-2 type transport system ATP-binding protein